MAESWFGLSRQDQTEALEVAADRTGRPAHLLEKDIWVVWTLAAIYESTLAKKLTFKGGTSLSKAYKIIDRFSEDVDLTYDIRELVPDLLPDGNPIPVTHSQEKKITSAVRHRLPDWITTTVVPIINSALIKSNLEASLIIAGTENEKLIIHYPALKTGTGYAAASIQLEFGARATGEPNYVHEIECDIASVIDAVDFPTARPLVMAAERTFWEKATAAHVYCLQGRLRGERYSRHWYDLVAISQSNYYESAIGDSTLRHQVAEHKSMFFAEKERDGSKINYRRAVTCSIQLIPQGDSLTALERDYEAMLEDGLLALHQPNFAELIEQCRAVELRINQK
jgi:hypothetical protein